MMKSAKQRSEFPDRPQHPEAMIAATGNAVPYRSVVRSPVARLTILDDGSTGTGETCWLRASQTEIGRSDCDIRLPNDPDVSAHHAQIVRREQNGSHTWHLIDSNSTNGSFIRSRRYVLRNGQELLLGGRRYQFKCQDTIQTAQPASDQGAAATRRQVAPVAAQLARTVPQLVERNVDQPDRSHRVTETGILMGRDPVRCGVCIKDPFLDSVHAEFFKDERRRWIIRDRASLNGIWVRVYELLLDPGAEFQLGGQRFRFDLN